MAAPKGASFNMNRATFPIEWSVQPNHTIDNWAEKHGEYYVNHYRGKLNWRQMRGFGFVGFMLCVLPFGVYEIAKAEHLRKGGSMKRWNSLEHSAIDRDATRNFHLKKEFSDFKQ